VLRKSSGPASRRRGFTLVELLVVMAVISILAGLVLPVVATALGRSEVATCLNNLRQLGTAYINYTKDVKGWMVCCGYYRAMGQAHVEWPMDVRKATEVHVSRRFPYWYQELAPYIDPSATRRRAIEKVNERLGTNFTLQNPPAETQIALDTAALCGILACPAKISTGGSLASVGYGYHYTAPFGVREVYKEFEHPFRWYGGGSGVVNWAHEYSYPVWSQNGGEVCEGGQVTIPVLWFGQCIHLGSITNPSAQISFCDTGCVVNDEANETDPLEWLEDTETWVSNVSGYVRFPLCEAYMSNGKYTDGYNFAWRPVPRHGDRTSCLFFDGSARSISVVEIVGARWGQANCLFDNLPHHKPPVPHQADPAWPP